MAPRSVADRLEQIRRRIADACRRGARSPHEITIVAVTKGVAPEVIREAIAAGVRHVGENRVQEAQAKRPELKDLPSKVRWHMVGHLQSNKVKTAILLFDIIHSVDSLPLAEAISRRASSRQPIFLEVNVSEEPGKYGFSLDELPGRHQAITALPNIEVRGLMTVARQADDPEHVRPVFRRLREAAAHLGLGQLSMGMSNDFEVAIEEGATHVRIGRAIFGEQQ
jgi:pyridoxal phosphate enzyme (YggS family)